MSMSWKFRLCIFAACVLLLIIWTYSIRSRYENFGIAPSSGSDGSCVSDIDKPYDPDVHLTGVRGDIWDVNRGTGDDTDPWLRHSINGSVAVDPHVTFDRAYYYELDNARYTDGLRKALTVSCSLIADAVNQSNWGESVSYRDRDIEGGAFALPLTIPKADTSSNNVSDTDTDKYVLSAYAACIDYISRKLNTSDALALPGDARPQPIQIVHDILSSYKVHRTENSMYLLVIELLLYRENKYHAKHVKVTCVANQPNHYFGSDSEWVVNVVAVTILGVVPEDQIALFPVIASNPRDVEQLLVANDVDAMGSSNNPNVDCTIDTDKKIVVCTPSQNTLSGIVNHAQQYQNLAKSKLALIRKS